MNKLAFVVLPVVVACGNKRSEENKGAAATTATCRRSRSPDGELGLGKPVTLDSKTPDKMAGMTAQLVNRCGDRLGHGSARGTTTWAAGPGCDTVAKVEPSVVEGVRPAPSHAQLSAVAPGTGSITAQLLGVKGDVVVAVK